MEIRTDTQKIHQKTVSPIGGKAADKGAFFDTKDSIVKGEVQDSAFKKPEIKTEEEEETEPKKSVDSTSPVIAGAEATPGPGTAVVAAQLQKLGRISVEFFKKRRIPIPFSKHKKITPKEAASTISEGDTGARGRLRAKIGKAGYVPLSDVGDVKEMSLFKGIGTGQFQQKDIADFIKYAGSIGLEFKSGGQKNVGEYGAYNYLATGWEIAGESTKPVELVRDGTSIMTLNPNDNRSPDSLRKELDESWKATNEINQYENSKAYFKSFGRPIFDLSFLERFKAFDKMDKYARRALYNYEIVTKHSRDKQEFEDVVDVLDKQEIITSYSDPEFAPEDVELMMKRVFQDDASPREKSEVIRSLRKQVSGNSYHREHKEFVRKSFKLVQKYAKSGPEFLKFSRIYVNMADAMGINSDIYGDDVIDRFGNAKNAFKFIVNQLKGDQDEADAFVGLLRGSTVKKAQERFQFIQMPVKNEDIATRVKVSHALIKTKGFEDNYRTVLENTGPGEDPMELAELMKRIRNKYGDDTFNSRKTFIDIKRTARDNGMSIGDCNGIMNIFGTGLPLAFKGIKLLAKPVGSESTATRKDVFSKLRANYNKKNSSDKAKRNDNNAMKDYEAIVSHKLQGETLEMAAKRFQMIFDNLGGHENSDEIRDAYIVVSENMKQGGSALSGDIVRKAILAGKNEKDIRRILREGLQEAAKDSPPSAGKQGKKTGGKKIVQEKEKVIIGGVTLDKQKYDNLLRVLDEK